ncbi:MAG TPA: helix-turn-helix domain-containing protein [Vicinamibacterales bacterium]|jgi:DNA-binding HxlR family transcriptional regulator|nr:helix-turn-helix domain-containing protein [Vicinamibacterales bacterium]
MEYHQYCPVARASEILADRWTPLIVRELLAGCHHFNEIERGLPGISRSLLVSRLRQLEDTGVVERRVSDRPKMTLYELTPAGRDLQRVLDRLGAWAIRWVFRDPRPDEEDPVLMAWMIRRRIRKELLPPQRTVVELDFTGRGAQRLWLVLEPHETSVCLKPPGFDPHLIVKSDLAYFQRVWAGQIDYDAAVRSGHLVIEGAPALVRAFPRWLLWSPMARFVHAERERRSHAAAAV